MKLKPITKDQISAGTIKDQITSGTIKITNGLLTIPAWLEDTLTPEIGYPDSLELETGTVDFEDEDNNE